MTQDFDPVAFKETTRRQWQNAAAAWDEIEQELSAFEGSGGFEAPSELVVGAGTK